MSTTTTPASQSDASTASRALRTESTRDQNYLSISQGIVEFYSGTDHPESGTIPEPPHILPVAPKNWDAVLKVSNSTGLELRDLRVAQGRENAIDCNNHAAYCLFAGEIGMEGDSGDQVITVKGGSYELAFEGRVHSRGNRADCAIGLWSDQSFNPSHHLDFSRLTHITGRRLTFILGRVNNPLLAALGRSKDITLPPGAKVLFWASVGALCHWWLKWAGVKTRLIKGRKQQ